MWKNMQGFSFPKSKHRLWQGLLPSIERDGKWSIRLTGIMRAEIKESECAEGISLSSSGPVLLHLHSSWPQRMSLSLARQTKQKSWRPWLGAPGCEQFAHKGRSPFCHCLLVLWHLPHISILKGSSDAVALRWNSCFGFSPVGIFSPQHCLQPLALA